MLKNLLIVSVVLFLHAPKHCLYKHSGADIFQKAFRLWYCCCDGKTPVAELSDSLIKIFVPMRQERKLMKWVEESPLINVARSWYTQKFSCWGIEARYSISKEDSVVDARRLVPSPAIAVITR